MNDTNGHIPEHELLEFIEGGLAADRSAVVAAALRRDPRLARLVTALQDDRRGLVALGQVRAPEELAERVEAILERQALLGLSDFGAASEPASLPISRLRPSRGSIVTRAWRSPAGRVLAAAAALVLVAGGAFWTVSLLQKQQNTGPSGPTVVINDPGPATDLADDTADTAAPAGTAIATAPVDDEPATPELAPEAPAIETIAAADAATGTAVDDAAAAIIAPRPAAVASAGVEITPARAIELARRGRLAIVVSSLDTDAAVTRVEALAKGPGSGRVASWRRIDDGLSGGPMLPGYETVATLWSPQLAPGFEVPSPFDPANPITVASGAAPLSPAFWPGVRVPMSFPPVAATVAAPAAVYAVSLEDRAGTLASLVSALRRDGGPDHAARTARFVELPTPIDPTPAADADAVLWWTGAPSTWTWRVSVPVIVEDR